MRTGMAKQGRGGRTIGGRLARLGVAACLGVALAGPAAAAELMVHVFHGKLDPATAEIAKGDTIVFHNLDAMPGGHTVVADDGSFSSPSLAKDAQWKKTFEASGSFGVHLKEHPNVKGVIRVR